MGAAAPLRRASRRPREPQASIEDAAHAVASAPGRLARTVAGRVVSRGRRPAALDQRDPDRVRELLPGLWLLSTLWFRGEVRGLGNIPDEGPVVLVGNHSGGRLSPDTAVLGLAFSTYFGVERRFHALTDRPPLRLPGLGALSRFGVVAPTREHLSAALGAGAAVLTYPGGLREAHRPSWRRHELDLGALDELVAEALAHDAPLVGVVAVGGQETALFLTAGEGLARRLGLDRAFGIRALPVALALPWGLSVGDVAGHLPLPSKVVVEVLAPVDVRAEFGDDPDPAAVGAHLERLMRETLDALGAERRRPLLG